MRLRRHLHGYRLSPCDFWNSCCETENIEQVHIHTMTYPLNLQWKHFFILPLILKNRSGTLSSVVYSEVLSYFYIGRLLRV